MSKMQIKDIVNAAWTQLEGGFTLPAGAGLYDVRPEDIPFGVERFRAVDGEGGCVGVGSARRLRMALEIWRKIPLAPMLDELTDAVVAVDMNGVIFYVNPAYAQLLNVPVGAVLGQNMFDIEAGATLLKTLQSGEAITKDSVLIESVQHYVQIKAFPLEAGGRMLGAASIFRDTTEFNQLSMELERASQMAAEYNRQIEAQTLLKQSNIIGECRPFLSSVVKATAVAATDATVLLRGESGTGKEVFARLIHQNSARKDKPFIAVNCAAIPESLIESELFGYEEGSFTGARRGGQLGKFQLAEGGTLFLDEVGDMPYAMQAKLLRVLQEGEIEKVGRQRAIKVDVRLVAGTNRPLEQMIEQGQFRQDLFYRLNVVPIVIPPLRERGHDVVLLAAHYLEQYNKKYHKSVRLTEEGYRLLLRYSWPGNIRELQNILESCVVLCSREYILPEDLPSSIHQGERRQALEAAPSQYPWPVRLEDAVARCEEQVIRAALKNHQNNRQAAADSLGISRRTFYRKVQQYQIPLD